MDKEMQEQYQKSVDIAEKIMGTIAGEPFNDALFGLYICIAELLKSNVEDNKIAEICFMCAEFVLTMCGFEVERKEMPGTPEDYFGDDDEEETFH
jgi:hypothetical protein